jgi:hypothetical protein
VFGIPIKGRTLRAEPFRFKGAGLAVSAQRGERSDVGTELARATI